MGRRRSTRARLAMAFMVSGKLRAFLVVGLAFLSATFLSSFVRHAMAINIVMNYKSGHQLPSYDPDGSRLIALMSSIESYYQDIFEESGHTLTVEFYYDNLDDGTLAVHNNLDTDATWPWEDGQPTKCRIRFDAGRDWFIDDTPFDNSEFNMKQTLYRDLDASKQTSWFKGDVPDLMEVTYKGKVLSSAPAEAKNAYDMWTVALHEMGHGLGMTGNCASEDVDDGEYDFSEVLAWGYDIEANYYASDNKYHLKADALMDPYTSKGERHLPSMVDILTMQDAGEWKADYIDLPRQDFYSSSATADFNTRTNWSGNQVPGSGDETHVRHGRTASLSANLTVAALGVESSSTVNIGSYTLTVNGDTRVGTSSTQTGTITIGSGELDTDKVTVSSGSLLSLGGGVLDADATLLQSGGTISGKGTIRTKDGFQIGGTLRALGGTLTVEAVSGNPTVDLDQNSGAQIIADTGNIIFDLPVNDAVGSNLTVNNGRTMTFNHDWTLDTGGDLYLNSTGSATKLAGAQADLWGGIHVSGTNNRLDCPVVFTKNTDFYFSDAEAILEFYKETTYDDVSISSVGSIHQTGNATVTAATDIDVDYFDLDGRNGTTVWTLNSPLNLTCLRAESESANNNIFNGTIQISKSGALRLTCPVPLELSGTIEVDSTSTASTSISSNQINIRSGGSIDVGRSTTFATAFDVKGTLAVNGSGSRLTINNTSGNDSTITGGTITGDGTLVFAGKGLSGFGTLDVNTDFSGQPLTATGGVLTVTKSIQGPSAIKISQGTLHLDTPLNIASMTKVELDQGILTGASIYNNSLFFRGNGTVSSANFTNTGNIVVSGGDLIFDTTGACLLDNNDSVPETISVTGGNLHIKTNQAVTSFNSTLIVSNSHELRMDHGGLIVMPDHGNVVLSQGSLAIPEFFQGGNLSVEAGVSSITGSVTFMIGSRNYINGILTCPGNVTISPLMLFSGNGKLVTAVTSTMTCLDGSEVGVDMGINGRLHLDDDLGDLTVDADLEFGMAAELFMDLGLSGFQYDSDHLTIVGETDLGGSTLHINLLDDILAKVGDQFDLFDWGTMVTGTFDDVIAPEGYAFDLSKLYTDGLISVSQSPYALPGDANRDGRVDGSDVTILANHWQHTYKITWEDGDFNGDGKVDGSDVTILANHWQEGITTTAAAVPEPSTMMMVSILAAFGLIGLRRRIK